MGAAVGRWGQGQLDGESMAQSYISHADGRHCAASMIGAVLWFDRDPRGAKPV